jgi:uncharacterized membrane protein
VEDRFDSSRAEAFSDGVFAIAITLLVLELSVPAESFDDLLQGILDQWPSYLAHATSFWTIAGVCWSTTRSSGGSRTRTRRSCC